MKREQILRTIKQLAMSQGFYGRLLAQLNEMDDDTYEDFMQNLEAQKFGDAVALVMYLEGC